MIRLLILGATGSIGTTALNAIRSGLCPDVSVAGITACSSPSLKTIAEEFSVPYSYLDGGNQEAIKKFIVKTNPDIVLNAISGASGLPATLAVIESGKDLALANKESVVMGGTFMLNLAKKHNVRIIPVDSEHSAIYHLLKGKKARKLIITASGGPFVDRKNLEDVTLEEALHHPTWKMGKKITIDSATLANKGLEVIEASLLFSFPPEKIDVTVHRQSIVHSMIETEEGAVYMLASPPDMTLPILLAIKGENNGLESIVRPLPFSSSLTLTFEGWDRERFPLLEIAYEALRKGGGYRIAYCRADEIAVNAFIAGRINFNDIPRIVRTVMDSPFPEKEPESYEEIIKIDNLAKERAEALC